MPLPSSLPTPLVTPSTPTRTPETWLSVSLKTDLMYAHANPQAMIFFYYGFYNIAMSALLVSYTVEM
jgi:hypothetical protein